MTRLRLLFMALFCLTVVLFGNACAGSNDLEATGECRVDSDCVSGVCYQDSLTCQTPISDRDTGFSDTGNQPQDTGGNLTDTAGPPDANTPDTNGDLDVEDVTPDVGVPVNPFSGCTNNAECAAYQECNVDLGRCEDARQACTSNGACGAGGLCLTGRCATPCTPGSTCPGALTCVDVGDDVHVCEVACSDFGSGGASCGQDAQCVPFMGTNSGLCRGTGTASEGEFCEGDFGPQSCQHGGVCVSLRGESICADLCAASGGPSCPADSFCALQFQGQSAAQHAGTCLTNCGGLGESDSSLCPGDWECHPISNSQGFCRPPGTVALGGSCRFDGLADCEGGLYCNAAGIEAIEGEADTGVCMEYCNPNDAQKGCSTGYTCFARDSDPNFGFCEKACDPAHRTELNGCPTGLKRCLSGTFESTPPTPGVCIPAGDIASGASCLLDDPLYCNENDWCVQPNEVFGGYVETGTETGQCTTYCVPFDYGTQNRCNVGQVCAVHYFDGLGFCTSNRTSVGRFENDSCSGTTNNQKWCADNLLCLPWNNVSQTCRIPCHLDVPGTCRAGQSCVAVDPSNLNNRLGSCR